MSTELLLENIYESIEEIHSKYNLQPNMIILGREVVEQIMTYTEKYMIYKDFDNNIYSIYGVPVTVDEVHTQRIMVGIGQDIK